MLGVLLSLIHLIYIIFWMCGKWIARRGKNTLLLLTVFIGFLLRFFISKYLGIMVILFSVATAVYCNRRVMCP